MSSVLFSFLCFANKWKWCVQYDSLKRFFILVHSRRQRDVRGKSSIGLWKNSFECWPFHEKMFSKQKAIIIIECENESIFLRSKRNSWITYRSDQSIERSRATTFNFPNAETLLLPMWFSLFNDRDKHTDCQRSLEHTINYSWSYRTETFIVHCSKWIQVQQLLC